MEIDSTSLLSLLRNNVQVSLPAFRDERGACGSKALFVPRPHPSAPPSAATLPVRVSNRANALRARRSHQGEPPPTSTSSTFLSCDILK